MADRSALTSPLGRARLGIVQWLEALPKDFQFDAMAALDRLFDVAIKDIEQAYFDGYNQARSSRKAVEMQKAIASLSSTDSGAK